MSKLIQRSFLLILFFALGLLYSYGAPQFKLYAVKKFHQTAREKAKLKISLEDFQFTLLPLGVELTEVKALPLDKDSPLKDSLKIEKLGIYLNLFSLALGKLEVGTISLENPQATLVLPISDSKDSKIEVDLVPFYLKSTMLPFNQIVLKHAKFQIDQPGGKFSLKTNNLDFIIRRDPDYVFSEVLAPQLELTPQFGNHSKINLTVAARARFNSSVLEVMAAKVSYKRSIVLAKSFGPPEINNNIINQIAGRLIVNANLDELNDLIQEYKGEKPFPYLSGYIDLDALSKPIKINEPVVAINLKTSNLKIHKFFFGEIDSQFKYTRNTLSSNFIHLNAPFGKAKVEDLTVSFQDSIKYLFRLVPDNINLHDLLINLSVGNLPVELTVNGKVPCMGTITPELLLECAGEATGTHFRVRADHANRNIVALKGFTVTSTLKVDKTAVTFPRALIQIGESKGEASGFVNYKEGFSFNYTTDSIGFTDVESLGDLKFEGILALNGTTSGDSKSAVFGMNVRAQRFWFEDFGLGNFATKLNYKSGTIFLNEIVGNINSSDYKGQLSVHLNDDVTIKAKASGQNVRVADALYGFSRKMTLPFETSGEGSFDLIADGPPDLAKLNYILKTKLPRGSAVGERFSDIYFDVTGKNGNAKADRVQGRKGDGIINLNGQVTNKGIMDVEITGRGIKFSDFDISRALTPGLEGDVNFEYTMKDFILRPTTELKARATNNSFDLDDLADSEITLQTRPEQVVVDGNFLDGQIRSKLTYPLSEGYPFKWKFDSKGWDFSHFLGAVTGKSLKKDYETSLIASIDLDSPTGSFWKSNGFISINRLFVKRGSTQLENTEPLNIKFKDGHVAVKSFHIAGNNTDLTLSGQRTPNDQLNFLAQGHLDITLLSFLTPFFRDLSGQMVLSTQFAGSTTKPILLGNAFIKGGYIKLSEFPHPFEDINADISFSQSRAIINRGTCRLGGGNLTASGTATFNSFGNIPVEVSGEIKQGTFNVPQGMTSQGDATYSVSGSWFPYLLKLDYNITRGLYTKPYGEAEISTNTVKRSSYLPRFILQKDFTPMEMNLNVDLGKGIVAKNNLIEGEARGHLNITGDPNHFLIRGTLEALPGAKLIFRDTQFTLSTGKMVFNNPNENNPELYTVASARVRDWDVNLLVQGTVNNTKFTMTSSPPLPEKKIISLLALGSPDDSVDDGTSQTSQLALESVGGAILNANPLRKEIQNKLGVNIKLSQKVNETKNTTLPRVVAEKQWTPELSMRASRTFGGEGGSSDAAVEYKLNKRFSVLGSFENRDLEATSNSSSAAKTQTLSTTENVLGLELRYQVEFK